tara:strand:+ start:694 stop:1233 length:540 start_codon:yes stop_codon:yes gene_type:complete
MKSKKILELLGEGGSVVFEELTLEGNAFYVQKTSEDIFDDMGLNTKNTSPLFTSFGQALQHCEIDVFFLYPAYIDPSVKKELSAIYSNYCDGKSPGDFNNKGWDKALGVKEFTRAIDDLISLGISEDNAFLLKDILSDIKINRNKEKEIEELLADPFAFEGGGPGTRELILLLVRQIRG